MSYQLDDQTLCSGNTPPERVFGFSPPHGNWFMEGIPRKGETQFYPQEISGNAGMKMASVELASFHSVVAHKAS
jgi:hypothetical protein